MRNIIAMIAIILVITMTLVIFCIVVPAMKTLTLTADSRQDHIGIEYFEEKEYINYEYGDAFKEMLVELDALEKGIAVDFYHTDNSWAKFTLYGNLPHIFALDVKINQGTCSIEDIISEANADDPIEMYDYLLYYIPRQEGVETHLKVIAVCEKVGIVRYIYISKVSRLAGYDSVLTRCSALDWTAEDNQDRARGRFVSSVNE